MSSIGLSIFSRKSHTKAELEQKLKKYAERRLPLNTEYEQECARAQTRKENFEKVLVVHLESIYENCKKLKEASEKETWLDTFKYIAEESVILTTKVAVTGGLVYLGGCLIGKKNEGQGVAIAASVAATLVCLWGISKDVEAKNNAIAHAKAFLTMVNDIEGDNKKEAIRQRMQEIAKKLCDRFANIIESLTAHEEGTEQLAIFFATAIARDFPKEVQKSSENKKPLSSAEDIVEQVIKSAIPSLKNDTLYNTVFWKNKKLKGEYEGWTIPGVLLRSPIYNSYNQKYYVRDGKKKDGNRSDKYPCQLVNEAPMRYVEAGTEDLKKINNIQNALKKQKIKTALDLLDSKKAKIEAELGIVKDQPAAVASAAERIAVPPILLTSQNHSIDISPDREVIKLERDAFLKKMKEDNAKMEKEIEREKIKAEKAAKEKLSSGISWKAFVAGTTFNFIRLDTDEGAKNKLNNK